MPCNSDYMKATGDEIALSMCYQLLDELDGKQNRPKKSAWRGYDDRAYGKFTKEKLDTAVRTLCGRLKKMEGRIIQTYSLELQLWWRDHQEADRKRELEEAHAKAQKKIRAGALKKLTKAERAALKLREED